MYERSELVQEDMQKIVLNCFNGFNKSKIFLKILKRHRMSKGSKLRQQ